VVAHDKGLQVKERLERLPNDTNRQRMAQNPVSKTSEARAKL